MSTPTSPTKTTRLALKDTAAAPRPAAARECAATNAAGSPADGEYNRPEKKREREEDDDRRKKKKRINIELERDLDNGIGWPRDDRASRDTGTVGSYRRTREFLRGYWQMWEKSL